MDYKCFALRLTSPEYWKTDTYSESFWSIQLATVFAILAVLGGSIAFLVLLRAMCFPLEIKTLRMIAYMFLLSGILSLCTLIALVPDQCSYDCTPHMEAGAVSMIFAAFLFILAFVTVRQYARMVDSGELPRDADEDEKTHLVEHHHEDVQSVEDEPDV